MPSFEAQMIGTKQNKLELQDFANHVNISKDKILSKMQNSSVHFYFRL